MTVANTPTLEADAYVLVSWWRDRYAEPVPPSKGKYIYEHHTHLNDALDAYADYERGEYRLAEPVGIFPVRNGLPFGPALSPQYLALALREFAA